jgi:hypothetical protein
VGRYFRFLGVATLVAASLNVTAGLCFCRRGPDAPISRPGHSCCHPAGDDGALALRGAGTCCHIEAAQRDMTPTDAVQLAAPAAASVDLAAPASRPVQALAVQTASTPSPPIRILRL